MRYQLAIFDMDGTILNTLQDLTNSLNAALQLSGYPQHTLEEVRFFVGNGIRKLIERGVPAGTPVAQIDKVHQDFTEHYRVHCADTTQPYAGIPELLQQLGYLADRLSVNVELPSEQSLNLLAPDKGRHSIFRPMKQIAVSGAQSKQELTVYRHAPKFAPAGQSTQMIVGASPETDYHILKLTEGMYHKYGLKRVFYSAYIPVAEDTRLPALDTKPPLLREHRLYQADWLLRFYQFEADEILDKDNPNFNPYLDPKCNWAVQHYGLFPVDVNRAPFEMLLRVPGIGPKSARRIWHARKQAALGLDELKRMGVVLKRAQYFITCRGFSGAHPGRGSAGRERITRALIDPNVFSGSCEQLSLFSPPAVDNLIGQGVPPRAAVRMVREEAVQCLAKAL